MDFDLNLVMLILIVFLKGVEKIKFWIELSKFVIIIINGVEEIKIVIS